MSFLVRIHRSIVDPKFYVEVARFPVRSVLLFLLQVTVVANLICAATHTMRILNVRTGLPAILPYMLPGMAVVDGHLVSEKTTPFVPNPGTLARFVSVINDVPVAPEYLPDSLVVVDTAPDATIAGESAVTVLLAGDAILVHGANGSVARFPYAKLLVGSVTLSFSSDAIGAYLRRNAPVIVLLTFAWHGLRFLGSVGLSVLFLALAAYIFKRGRKMPFGVFLRVASFSISPIAIANVLVALSGTRILWGWHVAIFFSTFIMFRGVAAVAARTTCQSDGSDRGS